MYLFDKCVKGQTSINTLLTFIAGFISLPNIFNILLRYRQISSHSDFTWFLCKVLVLYFMLASRNRISEEIFYCTNIILYLGNLETLSKKAVLF